MSYKKFDFTGQAGLVTGAGSGIGRASAIALAQNGAKVLVCDINEAGAAETVELIIADGGTAAALCGDVSQSDYADSIVKETIARFGSLDFAHNNAGIEGQIARTAEADLIDFQRSLAVNLTGVWLCMRAEIREMVRNGKGSIVNTSSVAGLTAVPGAAAYGAAKHGVIGLTKTAAVEYAEQGIRVNAICPGLTRSGITKRLIETAPELIEALLPPMKRLAEPDEIAGTVVFLLSDAATYLSGQAIAIDGAATAI